MKVHTIDMRTKLREEERMGGLRRAFFIVSFGLAISAMLMVAVLNVLSAARPSDSPIEIEFFGDSARISSVDTPELAARTDEVILRLRGTTVGRLAADSAEALPGTARDRVVDVLKPLGRDERDLGGRRLPFAGADDHLLALGEQRQILLESAEVHPHRG